MEGDSVVSQKGREEVTLIYLGLGYLNFYLWLAL